MKESVTQLATEVNNRFEQYLLSLDKATVMSGRKTRQMKELEDSEQYEARRELLFIEELATKKREEIESKENSYIAQIEREFHDVLMLEMDKQLCDTSELMRQHLKLEPAVGRLLDVLYTEACTISKLVECIEPLPWLTKSIINFIRQPKYRRVDSQGHPLIIKTLRGAVSFIGIDSLRKLIPALIAKYLMPPNSTYMPDMKKHLWLYTIGAGNVANTLASSMDIKPHFGFNIGLLSIIGRSAVASVYLKRFDNVLQDVVTDARKKNDHNLAEKLTGLVPSQKYLISCWKKYADSVTANVISKLKLRWMMIAPGFQDNLKIRQLSYQYLEEQKLHPLTHLLFKSQGYMHFKLLQQNKLITKEASALYLRNYGVNDVDIAMLSKINLTGLELKIAEKIEEES
ncbi:MAG: HDOD domain-containing protein [Pseudomonadota bacterium]